MAVFRKAAQSVVAIALLLGHTVGAGHAEAAGKPPQKRANRYVPSRPTTSPYLDLTRAETGVLPNYFTFVRPKLDQQAINQNQSMSIAGLQTNLQQAQGDIVRLTSPQLRPTGTGATHGNLSHYFPELPNSRR